MNNNIIIVGNARFSVLSSRVIRMEYSKDGIFEDKQSQVFINRTPSLCNLKHNIQNNALNIETDDLLLTYSITEKGFASDTLNILIKSNNTLWKYGDENRANLKGTIRTLDKINGATSIGEGLISKLGWYTLDDSKTLLYDKDGWIEERKDLNPIDTYFFGYGNKYIDCLNDYLKLSGSSPLIPRWVLGNWWSRYYEYSSNELLSLMDDFSNHDIPLSVCIVDMDWHIVHNQYSKGWTGYTWNRKLFPQPETFINEIHKRNLKTALNLHPADGLYPHEEKFEEFASFLDIDTKTTNHIEFDITDKKFVSGYFKILHEPIEKQGVDFWWMDWQQGEKTKLNGLDPLWWLNHIHFDHAKRNINNRPVIFSRWSGLGNQRYPIGFSGDTVVSFDSLSFQPYFTATAANVGCFWWSHDIGGHMQGIENGELYARWIQFGVFSPVMRIHSTKNQFQDRRPWKFDENIFSIIKEYMQLRHKMIPYLYTMAKRTEKEGRSILEPMYYNSPDREEAYNCPEQYWFGSELIAAPHTKPMDKYTNMAKTLVWLDKGIWFNFFTGEIFKGDNYYSVYGTLSETPIFAKSGAIIPLSNDVVKNGVTNPQNLTIKVFPCGNNNFSMYEDDGETQNYINGHFAITNFIEEWTEKKQVFIIENPSGDLSTIPCQRNYSIEFVGITNNCEVSVYVNNNIYEINRDYDYERNTLKVSLCNISNKDTVKVIIETKDISLLQNSNNLYKKIYNMLKTFSTTNIAKDEIYNSLESIISDITLLSKWSVDLEESQMIALIETIKEVGIYKTSCSGEEIITLWNNNHENVPYYISSAHEWEHTHEKGIIPKSKIINSQSDCKKIISVDFYGLSKIDFE